MPEMEDTISRATSTASKYLRFKSPVIISFVVIFQKRCNFSEINVYNENINLVFLKNAVWSQYFKTRNIFKRNNIEEVKIINKIV